jgi:hypothetical protein
MSKEWTPGPWRIEQDTTLVGGDCVDDNLGVPVAEAVGMGGRCWGRDATMFVGAIEALSDFVAPWKDDARIALWRRYGDPPPISRMPTSRAAASRTPQKLKNETLMLPLLNIRMDLRGVLQGQGETE